MIFQSTQESLESKLALKGVIDPTNGNNLTPIELITNIANNLCNISIIDGMQEHRPDGMIKSKILSAGTGLRITTDGYVLTAYHIIAPYLNDWVQELKNNPPTEYNENSWLQNIINRYLVIDQDQYAYPIDIRFWAADPANDIALIKIVNWKKPEPIPMQTIQQDLEVDDEIQLLAIHNQKLFSQSGKVVSPSYTATINDPDTLEICDTQQDTFKTDALSTIGFSGGVFYDQYGNYAGMLTSGALIKGSNIGHAVGTKAKYIAKFINQVITELAN